jgi:RHS repeat-associated protein
MYNALGQRVEDYQGHGQGNPMTLTYPVDIFGQRTGAFAQWPSQNWTGWNVYWASVAGQRLNMGGADAYIDHSDAVGSTTMETDPAGAVQWDVTHYPWGRVFQETGIRQSEVVMGLDWQVNDPVIPSATREFNFRDYRWMTPDPMGGDVTNPQSLNRYAYVLNNPTTLTDPSGLQPPHHPLYRPPIPPCAYCADIAGNDIFDALGGSPGTYLTMDEYGNLGFGFSIDKWFGDERAQEVAFQNSAAYSNGFQNQLSAAVADLKLDGTTDTQIATFVSDNEQRFAAGGIDLTGGNFDFIDASIFASIYQNVNMCQHLRCDLGTQGTLDFSHGNNTVHLDTADPFSEFGLGLLVHFGVDVIWGNMGYGVLPR